MNELFNTMLTNQSADLSVMSVLIALGMSILLGILVTFTYYKTRGSSIYQRNFAITLIMLPIILCAIIMFVGSNVARAFSLAGTLSIIRFRSAPGDPKDIGYIFFDIAAGLSCGVGLYGYGALFVVILCIVLFLIDKFRIGFAPTLHKVLKITIPENLNSDGAFDDILAKYTTRYSLDKIRTTDLGSLFELVYTVTMDKKQNEQEFINELRCRNGNLTIVLALAATSDA